MATQLEKLLQEIQDIERRVTEELRKHRDTFRYQVEKGRVTFDREIKRQHRRVKKGLLLFLKESSLLNIMTAPVIYSLIVPAVVIDLWVQWYQWICFPIYGIPTVTRRKYFILDHRKLSYLNIIEKWNCIYCSYFNGLMGFIREVGSRTEQYWCPIRHSLGTDFRSTRDQNYLDYGDAEAYKQKLESVRRKFDDLKNQPPG